MKILKLSVLVALAFNFVPNRSFALTGGIGDGGGQGIVCRDDAGKVLLAEMLDLFEAKNFYQLPVLADPKNRSSQQIASDYAEILNQAMPGEIPITKVFNHQFYGFNSRPGDPTAKDGFWTGEVDTDYVLSHMLFIGGDLAVGPVGDSHPRVLPSGKSCSLEQIAVYSDGTEQIHVVENVWNKMDAENQAALLVHEALYRQLRNFGETSSDRTRKIVGYLFSGLPFTRVYEGLPTNKKLLVCWTTDSAASFRFVVYPSDDLSSGTAQFFVYNGEVAVSRLALPVELTGFGYPLAKDSAQSHGFENRLNSPLIDNPEARFAFKPGAGGHYDISFSALSEGVTDINLNNFIPVDCDLQETLAN